MMKEKMKLLMSKHWTPAVLIAVGTFLLELTGHLTRSGLTMLVQFLLIPLVPIMFLAGLFGNLAPRVFDVDHGGVFSLLTRAIASGLIWGYGLVWPILKYRSTKQRRYLIATGIFVGYCILLAVGAVLVIIGISQGWD